MRLPSVLVVLATTFVIGCGSAPARSPAEADADRTVLLAQPADGPHASVQAWCTKLGAPACEAREDIVVPIMRDPVTTRSGVKVEVLTAATRDAKVQRGIVLLKRGDEIFALPPVIEYPEATKHHGATIAGFKQFDDMDPDLVQIRYDVTLPAEGASRPEAKDGRDIQDLCSVKAGKPISCVRVFAGFRRDWPEAKEGEWSSALTLVMVKGTRFDTLIVEKGPAVPALRDAMVKDGKYELRFP